MATEPTLPIKVSASSVQTAVLAATRVLITLISGLGALAGLVSKGDLEGIYAFFAANQGLTFIAAVISVITFASSIYITILKHRKLVITATAAPNSVAQVTKP